MHVKTGFKIADAYEFAEQHRLSEHVATIRALPIHPTVGKPAAVRKGHLLRLFDERGLLDEFARRHWPAWPSPSAESKRDQFVRKMELNDRRLRGEDLPVEEEEEEAETEELAAFGLEAQLRDFIADNLALIAIGPHRLELFKDPSGRAGVEYPTDVGLIDILAIDRNGDFYVFELKLERGPDRALGQLARYMGWVKVHLAAAKQVWGVVVASSIDQRLRYAGSVMPQVRLLEYEVQFRLHDAQLLTSAGQ